MDIVGRDCRGILVYSASVICVANRSLVSLELRGASDGRSPFLFVLCALVFRMWSLRVAAGLEKSRGNYDRSLAVVLLCHR